MDPWADPDTPTEPGPPYAGPPVTGPPPSYGAGPYAQPYGWPPPGTPPYGMPYPPGPYGPGPWTPGSPPWTPGPSPWTPGPPPGAQRPGPVVGSAVLAFVQAALVLFTSLYVWMAVSLIGFAAGQAPGTSPSETEALAGEGKVLVVLGLLSTVLLVVGGVAALTRRSRTAWLLALAAHAVQVVLAAYWGIRLYSVVGDIPGAVREGAFASLALVFAIAPLIGLGLVGLGAGRRWFDGSARD